MRSVRLRADTLCLDYTHFTGQRRWTDERLAHAVQTSQSWSQVADVLGLKGGSSHVVVKAHAIRLGLDIAHMGPQQRDKPSIVPDPCPDLAHLPRAGSMLAAAWFTLCGHDVSWPLEPCRYDLLVVIDKPVTVQVKTARVRANKTWVAKISSSGTERRTYDPDEIDYFFIIDGELNYHLIPVAVVGGFNATHLSMYTDYRLPQLAR